MTKYNLTVKGMHCNGCKTLVTDTLEELNASNIKIDLDEKTQIAKISFELEGDKQIAIAAIEKEGYKVQ